MTRLTLGFAIVAGALLAVCAAAVAREAPLVDTAKAPIATTIGRDVLEQINGARTDPAAFAKTLPRTPGAAEARDALIQRQPVEPLVWDDRLTAAAIKHAADQGARGGHDHIGSDGSRPAERLRREGVWAMLTAEEMSLGQPSAKAVVIQLIIDEDVPTRAHRGDLLNPLFHFGGVGCAPHAAYRTICVIVLSGKPTER